MNIKFTDFTTGEDVLDTLYFLKTNEERLEYIKALKAHNDEVLIEDFKSELYDDMTGGIYNEKQSEIARLSEKILDILK